MTNATIDVGALGMDRGAHLLVKRTLQALPVGGTLEVHGTEPHRRCICAAGVASRGHAAVFPADNGDGPVAIITRGSVDVGRWRGALQTGGADATDPANVADHPSQKWGLAARGAMVEAGGPDFNFVIADKDEVWTVEASRLYLQAAGQQWDPETIVDWKQPIELPEEVETAVCQVMTYLIENETVAMIVPARFLAQIHPHFREILQVLAVQTADEARHIEVFTRRALLVRKNPGLSTIGGQESLKTLLDEPDFALATFLLSVLGEGSFLSLLWFLKEYAPDPITRDICKFAAQDEARHVAFGLAHLARHLERDPTLRVKLADAVERRHRALQETAGLNEEVFDALVILAAGEWSPAAIERGYAAVQSLKTDMDVGRRKRLHKLGFEGESAERLSSLHTRNFM